MIFHNGQVRIGEQIISFESLIQQAYMAVGQLRQFVTASGQVVGGSALGDAVCQHALDFARSVVPAQVQVEVFAIDRQGGIVGHAGAFA